MKIQRITLLYLSIINAALALDVLDIGNCSKPEPRFNPLQDATDVRVNDIKLVAGLGDSMMAGFLADNYKEFFSTIFSALTRNLIEFRGESYTMGGDEGVASIANFLKAFNPDILGASVGKQRVQVCAGECPRIKLDPNTDVLNAAISGAMSNNLDKELDYILDVIKNPKFITPDVLTGWKLINLQIGYNDVCRYCDNKFKKYTTLEAFEQNVEKAILRIKETGPKIILNIIELLDLPALHRVTVNQNYCFSYLFPESQHQCHCLRTRVGQELATYVTNDYNKILKKLAAKYSAKEGDQFATMFTPLNMNETTFKLEAFSRADCFHPSKQSHAFHAKTTWRNMFASNRGNNTHITYDENATIFCPGPEDRLATRLSDM